MLFSPGDISVEAQDDESWKPQPYQYSNRNDPETYLDTSHFRTDSPHPRALSVPASLESAVFEAPYNNLEKLVEELTRDVAHALERARIIHDWIALNIAYDSDALLSRRLLREDPAVTLTRRKAVCGGYARLFEYMSYHAGVEVETITGYSRGYGVDLFNERVTFRSHNAHAWNAVRFENNWYLVDVTWNAGYLQNGRFVADYGTEYLYAHPEQFIHTHYPQAPGWYLTERRVTRDRFESLPHLRPAFFQAGLELDRSIAAVNHVRGREFEVRIRQPEGTQLLLVTRDRTSREVDRIDSSALTDGRRWHSLRVEVPAIGRYRVAIYKLRDDETLYEFVGQFGVEAR